MMMVPVGVLDRMGVAAVDVSVDVSASEALSVDMDAEEEGGSEVDVMLELGSDMIIMEPFYKCNMLRAHNEKNGNDIDVPLTYILCH
jgi:hypothetical protein